MEHFIYTIKPVRQGFIESMTPEEEAIISCHFQYLKELMTQGKLLLAGPCLDSAFGIVILITNNEDEARTLMDNDPAVQGGVMTSELHPFRVSLMKQ